MASTGHCLFCFEVLAAHLEERKPLSLAEVQKSWTAYLDASNSITTKQLPALRRVTDLSAEQSSGSSSAASSTISLAPDTAATTPAGPSELSLASSSSAAAPVESPLFVTWNKYHPRHNETVLRGCIGTFEAQPLEEGLASYALTSALHDTRFDPVRPAELPSLEVAVTLLTDFEDAADAEDWDLGTHGLRISFYHGGRRHGATYLPDVPVEQNWDKKETLISLMRKAGWMARQEKWREVDLKIVRYQGKKVSLEYATYKAWRDWMDNKAGAAVA